MPEEAARAVLGDEGEGGARPTGSVTFLTFSLRGVKGQAVFLCLLYLFLCPAVLGAGDRGALLGSIISIGDRIWSGKTPLLPARAAASRCHGPAIIVTQGSLQPGTSNRTTCGLCGTCT